MARCLRDESGYSLVEVVVAIMLLGLAIIPMVGMFDAGLRASVVSSNYDRGRAIASEELAEIQALPFNRPSTAAPDSVVEFYSPDGNLNGTGVSCTPPIDTAFSCTVKATYVRYDVSDSEYKGDASVRTLIQATVTVRWNGNDTNCGGSTKCYTTTGLVSKGAE